MCEIPFYEPELGQVVFGQPSQELECPDYVISHLEFIRIELERVMYNITQGDFDDPFCNTGNVTGFNNSVFEVHAYAWNDEEQPFNFKFGDIKISWYKYLGRGMSINRQVNPDEAAQMLKSCLKSLEETEKEYFKDDPDY